MMKTSRRAGWLKKVLALCWSCMLVCGCYCCQSHGTLGNGNGIAFAVKPSCHLPETSCLSPVARNVYDNQNSQAIRQRILKKGVEINNLFISVRRPAYQTGPAFHSQQGSLHCTPEHSLGKWRFPFILVRKKATCFNCKMEIF